MNKHIITSCLLGIIVACQSAVSAPEDYLSPVDLVAGKDSKVIYVVEHTASKIAVFDIKKKKVTKSISLKGRPTGLALDKKGANLYVSTGEPEGKILVIDTKKLKIVREFDVGHTAMGPALSLDEKTLYVCNRFNNNVSVINLVTGKEETRIPMTREPVATVLTADGKLLYVANHLPTGAANVDLMTSVIDVIDTETKKVTASIPLPNGAIDLRGICLSQNGKYIFVPSILARFMVPTTQIERGWINTHAMSIIDSAGKKLLHTVLLDEVDRGAANPWGITCSADGKYICVAHSATHEVSIIDQAALFEKLSKIPAPDPAKSKSSSYAYNPANDLSFLTSIRRRITLKGNSPRGIITIGDKLFVTEYISDSIGMLNINPDINPDVESIPLGPVKPMDIVRLGEKHFWDAALCFQQWQSCATCHPDVRTDAVNWDLLNDGIGNPKNTKSLLNAHFTPPSMITGVRAKAEDAVRAGIRYIQFAVPEEEKATAIDAYLKSIKPIPSPFLVKGKLSKSAIKGKKVFKKADCIDCHSGEYYTDMQKYNIGTGAGMDEGVEFDTPTLRELWRTAPYLNDGRAANIEEVFTKFNQHNEHGSTKKLSAQEIKDLCEYIMSI